MVPYVNFLRPGLPPPIINKTAQKFPMQQDGPRLKKLKEVYRRAVQEILKEEEALCMAISMSESKDSFYGDHSEHPKADDIKKVFVDIRAQFSEAFKYKIRTMNLDLKLNHLDKDIKDARVSYQNIQDPNYIKEIFESHTVDKRMELHKTLEEILEKAVDESRVLEDEISELKGKIAVLENENDAYENEYLHIIHEMEAACDE